MGAAVLFLVLEHNCMKEVPCRIGRGACQQLADEVLIMVVRVDDL
jgi:hypothetical protein